VVTKGASILIIGAVLLVLASEPCIQREERRDPISRRIRLKYIGDCLAFQTPTLAFQVDPLLSLQLVPSSIQELAVDLSEIRRYMRLYMPRNLRNLVDTTDVVMLSNSAADYFTADWLRWISRGTESSGLGLIMIGGLSSFGGFDGYVVYPDWGRTEVGDLLPVETVRIGGLDGHIDFAFKLAPRRAEDPLISAFDWTRGPNFFAINVVSARTGSDLLAVSDPQGHPLIAYWEVGEGSALAFTSTWGNPWGNDFFRWEYFGDFSADLVYYSAGLEIPDPEVVHRIRLILEDFEISRGIVRSVIDFVDRLGGGTGRVQGLYDDLLLRKTEAEEAYIDQEYVSCLDQMNVLLDEMKGVSDAAIRAKDAAFVWIYLIEWCAVTGAVFLSGYFLYYAMVRRGLYRRVRSTRTG